MFPRPSPPQEFPRPARKFAEIPLGDPQQPSPCPAAISGGCTNFKLYSTRKQSHRYTILNHRNLYHLKTNFLQKEPLYYWTNLPKVEPFLN